MEIFFFVIDAMFLYLLCANATSNVGRRLLHNQVHHDGRRHGETVPCKDVLGMVVAKVDFGRASKGDTPRLVVDHFHIFIVCDSPSLASLRYHS